jgi:hypothetical protein
MDRRRLGPWVALVVLLSAGAAGAKPCGDDVNGQDVPCACGDIVVSSVVLGDDPVVHTVCAHDGLVVRAARSTPGVSIDLQGQTLRGAGHGAGLRVLAGGQSGARVVSSGGRATISGFQDGVVSHGAPAAVLVERLALVGNRRDGVRMEGGVYVVRDTLVRESGRDGFVLMGRNYQVSGTRAERNRRYGYMVLGQGATLEGAASAQSGATGFSVMGAGHRLVGCVAADGKRGGIYLAGAGHAVRGSVARGNAGDGISGVGTGWEVASNQARDNGNNGLVVSGPGVMDGGGNQGSGNRGQRQRRAVEQCTINHEICRR